MPSDQSLDRGYSTPHGVFESSAVVYDVLADRRRLAVVSILGEGSDQRSVEALATEIAARETGKSRSAVDEEERRRRAIDLVHKHLPALVDHDLVSWDREGDVVSLTDHPALDDDVLASRLDRTIDEREIELFGALRDERARDALSVLVEAGTLPIDHLGARVAARERDRSGAWTPSADERVLTSLVHVQLPRLSASGLVEFDRAAGEVSIGDRYDRCTDVAVEISH